MNKNELTSLVSAQPFTPFVIHMADGSAFDIRHPETIAVGPSTAVVLNTNDVFERLSIMLITRLEESPTEST